MPQYQEANIIFPNTSPAILKMTVLKPDNVRSIEQMVKDYNNKKEERRDRRLKEKESQQSGRDIIQS